MRRSFEDLYAQACISMMRSVLVALVAACASVGAFAPSTAYGVSKVTQTSSADSLVSLESCRRNTKKEKRARNQDNTRKSAFPARVFPPRAMVSVAVSREKSEVRSSLRALCYSRSSRMTTSET